MINLYFFIIIALIIAVTVLMVLYVRKSKRSAQMVSDLGRNHRLIRSFLSEKEDHNLYALNPDLEYLYFNDQHVADMKRLFDVEPQIGKSKIDLLPEPIASQYKALYKRALTEDAFTHTQKFGEQFINFHFGPVFEQDKIIGITVRAYRTTEKILLEQELEKHQDELEQLVIQRADEIVGQRNFFQTIIDEDPSLLFVRDEEGKYLLANKAVAQSFNREVEEVIGGHLNEFVPNDADKYLDEDRDIITKGASHISEDKQKRLDGDYMWLLTKKKRIQFGGKRFVLGVQSDITHLKEVQEDLEDANQRLSKTLRDLQDMQLKLIASEKIASTGLLTSALIHEINNPINYVAGNVEPLKRDFEDLKNWLRESGYFDQKPKVKSEFEVISDEIDELFSGIEHGANKVIGLIANLKKLAYHHDGKKEFCNINEYIGSTIKLVHPVIKDRIRIKEEYSSEIDQIYVDASQLNQIFLNILDLLIQESSEESEIQIKTLQKGQNILVEIKSSGTDLYKKELTSMIDPFDKEGDDSKLGLAISYRIINGMGGHLSLGNEKEQTILTISFPSS